MRDLHLMETMVNTALSFLRDQDGRERDEMVDLPSVLQAICDEFAAIGHDVRYAGPDHLTCVAAPTRSRVRSATSSTTPSNTAPRRS
jgi:hypothetical protein